MAHAFFSIRTTSSYNAVNMVCTYLFTCRHFELYYAVSGSGAIIHTVNPRLSPQQIVYIINHGDGKVCYYYYDDDYFMIFCYGSSNALHY